MQMLPIHPLTSTSTRSPIGPSMQKIFRCFLIASCLSTLACDSGRQMREGTASDTLSVTADTGAAPKPVPAALPVPARPLLSRDSVTALPDTAFVELIRVDTLFVPDMRYATADNFLKEKVYDCDKCLLRKDAALALLKAHDQLKGEGYRIKLFDCYRPLDVQKKMWKIMPDDRYVGNPYGSGSVHNKGAAVDLTLTDSLGRELEMGTPFDHFGREAHHAYTDLPTEVLTRRRILKEAMEGAGFEPITSEWWHYSYRRKNYPTANFKPECE
jgi:D-alanyl-D-alanine dipeptidase